MKKVNIVIAKSALETVPKELVDHPSVKRWAEKRGKDPEKALLDISYHYAAMKGMRDWNKRGRPDIVYVTLLNLLGSPLNEEGMLQVYVHTVKDFVITLKPEINLPRNYLRFVGLMEQLFEVGKVPPKGRWLMRLERMRLEGLLKDLKPSKTIFLTEKGKRVGLEGFGAMISKEDNPLLVIGGFQRGEFEEEDLALADERISLYKKALDAWVVASMVVHEVERALRIV
ncbi:MAG: 16S rRNA methyltransferase [Candidatus Methanomethylicaceae archaeon]